MAVATEERSTGQISESPWDGDANRFTDDEYKNSCVLDRMGDKPVRERCALPIREPNGDLSREGVHIAAEQLSKVTDATPASLRAARESLRSAYKSLGEEVPSSLEEPIPDPVDELLRQFCVVPGEERRGVTAMRAMGTEAFLFRAGDDDGFIGNMTGHFAVFNRWTEINSMFEGHFMERFAPGAFSKTMQDNGRAIRCLFQHGKDPQIGMKPLGPIRSMGEDELGANYDVPLLDTSYNRDLLPGLKQNLFGASFRFGVMREDVNPFPERSDSNPQGIEERTIVECRLREFGPVTFGQYADATASARGYTDEYLLEVQSEVQRDLLIARAIEHFRELHGGSDLSTAGPTQETEAGTTEERPEPPAEGAVEASAPDGASDRLFDPDDRLRTTRLPRSAQSLRTTTTQEPTWRL